MDEVVVVPNPHCFELGLAAGAALAIGITALVGLLFFHLVTIQWPPAIRRGQAPAPPARRIIRPRQPSVLAFALTVALLALVLQVVLERLQ